MMEPRHALKPSEDRQSESEEPAAKGPTLELYLRVLLVVVVTSAALNFARIVFEPIAFAFFGIALLWPVQTALQAKIPKAIALVLTISVALLVIFVLASAIVWSTGEVVHWIFGHVERFQSLHHQAVQWLDEHDLFVAEGLGNYDFRTFLGFLQGVAMGVNSFIGFCFVVLLLLTFGLAELTGFERRLEKLELAAGENITQIASEIAARLRTYMLIRTAASLLTGIAVFAFTLSLGVELAIAWGVISFVLNYIPYVGTLVAVVLPVLFAAAQFESWKMALALFAGLYVIQAVIGNYLEPMIAGRALAISPFVVLVAFFFWAFLWGLPGAFIGLPVTIALYTAFEQNPSTRWLAKLFSASGDI